MTSPSTKLYSSWFCPFAQRAWISLIEKAVEFQYVEIDPYNKTTEFLAINPRGLVPVIVNNGLCVYESSVCIEFADEEWKSQGNPLMPSDPHQRAVTRIWSDYISKKIVPIFYQILMRTSKEEQDDAKVNLLKNLSTLSKAMSDKGPYFMGSSFGLVDIMLVPFTLRFDILKHYRSFELPNNSEFSRLQTWMNHAHSRDSVKATLADPEQLLAKYQRYADNTAKSEVAEAIRCGNPLP